MTFLGDCLAASLSLLVVMSVTACDSPGEWASLSPPRAATILGVSKVDAPIDEATGLVTSCNYEASESAFTTNILLDTAAALQLTLPFTVRNDAAQATDEIRPLRMNVRWECDSNGFSGNIGPLVVPAFDPELPFCRSTRDEEELFVGFDAVPASGATVPGAGGLAVVSAQVVPFALGSAIDETFQIAALAEQCCFETRTSNCDGQSSGLACTRLSEFFAALDGDGSRLQVGATTGPSEDLVRFQAFALFNGDSACLRDRALCDSSTVQGPAYRMRLRGELEFLGAAGELWGSDEVTTDIDFCRNCGYWDGQARRPALTGELQCFAR